MPADSPLLPVVAWQPLCVFADGEEHERLRAAVTESMNRFDRRGIRRYVVRFANQLVDSFAADGKAELVEQFAEHLPMLTLTQLLGMPDEYGPRLVDAARDMLKGTETAIASNEYVMKTLRQLVAAKRALPGKDFASWLLEHRADLADDEAAEHLRLVLITAYETTANLIANTLRMVLTDPRFRASLAGGHMTLPDAVEQVLWDAPPFGRVYGRWATGDTEFADQKIKSGDLLVLGLAAGNIDPAIRPDLSVPVHGNRSHLSFSSGPHECPGQDIGRAIADTGIDALLVRLPDIELAVLEDQLDWESSLLSRRLMAVPVRFTPREPEAAQVTGSPVMPMPPESPKFPAPAPPPQEAPAAPVPASDRVRAWWRSLTRWLRAR
ncbi:cytochrome P450 [Streptantibioticus ferralitis]|uniref:cytochrome P450 n=1 Tax=Streptantibioticus ferralitis TaxID=236510 RepID=UPI003CD0BFA4